jgi:hypothetical protein
LLAEQQIHEAKIQADMACQELRINGEMRRRTVDLELELNHVGSQDRDDGLAYRLKDFEEIDQDEQTFEARDEGHLHEGQLPVDASKDPVTSSSRSNPPDMGVMPDQPQFNSDVPLSRFMYTQDRMSSQVDVNQPPVNAQVVNPGYGNYYGKLPYRFEPLQTEVKNVIPLNTVNVCSQGDTTQSKAQGYSPTKGHVNRSTLLNISAKPFRPEFNLAQDQGLKYVGSQVQDQGACKVQGHLVQGNLSLQCAPAVQQQSSQCQGHVPPGASSSMFQSHI